MSYLTNVAQVKATLSSKPTVTLQTGDEAIILKAIEHVSDRIEKLKVAEFEPMTRTGYFDARGGHIGRGGKLLRLDRPLLSVTSITLADGTVLQASDYILSPKTSTPYTEIILTQASGYYWTQYTDEWEQAIEIVGVWGYRSGYSSAFVSSGVLLNGAIASTTAASITVDSNTVLSPGMLIKIDTELMRVLTVPTATTATVTRGENGTTAATHADDAAISYWTPEPVILSAATRYADYVFSRRGAFEQTKFDGATSVQFPADMPGDVKGDLDSFYMLGSYAVL